MKSYPERLLLWSAHYVATPKIGLVNVERGVVPEQFTFKQWEVIYEFVI